MHFKEETLAVYIAKGSIEIEGQTILEFTMAILNANNLILFTALEESRIVIIGGDIMSPRFIDWNFFPLEKSVLNKQSTIEVIIHS